MRVYVITKGSYSDYHICCVCLERETAERRKKLFSDNYEEAEIEEFDTDEYEEFVKVDDQILRRDGKRLYRVLMEEYKDGDKMVQRTKVREMEIGEYELKESCWFRGILIPTPCGVYADGKEWVVEVFGRDEKEAEKRAFDLIAQRKYGIMEESGDV